VECIKFNTSADLQWNILGWPDRLGFVFRSLLANLLTLRSSDGKVQIDAGLDATGLLRIVLQLTDTEGPAAAALADESDPLLAAQQRAWEKVTLALDGLRTITRQHHGVLDHQNGCLGVPIFRLTLDTGLSERNSSPWRHAY